MSEPLRLLSVEDSPDDALLLVRELTRAGYEVHSRRVETRAELAAALDEETWDLVVADYALPNFSGLEALELVQSRGVDLPFIVVSGAVTEATAVAVMRAGAHDYVLKGNLARLGPAVARELREVRLRRERRLAAAELVELKERAAEEQQRNELRAHLMAEAGAKLGASLDLSSTLQTLATLAVPALGEGCLLEVVDADAPEPCLTAAAHVDPALVPLARALAARAPVRDALFSPHKLLPKEPEHVEHIPEPVRAREVATWGELGKLFPGPVCSLTLPLVARGRRLGTMTVWASEAQARRLTEELTAAKELARRGSLALENAELYQRARQAVAVRDEFLSVASHELRTPLTTLVLQLERLKRGAANLPEAAGQGERLEQALRQARRMAGLIESMLDVSRVSAGRLVLQPEEVDLREVMDQAVARMEPNAAAAGCEVRVDVAGALKGEWDRARLEQVLSNLLSNAFKYGSGAPVELLADGTRDRVRLTVRDHGFGIDECDRARIFARFERAVSARHYGGLGLGLFIARQIVEAHGGVLDVESRPGEGAAFTVELPRQAVAKGTVDPAPLTRPA